MYAANFGYSYMSALCITGKGLESRRSRETARPEDSTRPLQRIER